jgi:protein involved in polysaccharide export with SLBB domain
MMNVYRKAIATVLVLCHAIAVMAPAASAQQRQDTQTYRVGGGDRVFLSVPQRPELNQNAVVDEAGNITLPLVGSVAVRGLTADDIAARLLVALQEYYPSVTDVSVTVEPSGQISVYVIGEVERAGRYSFQEPPNLWEAIREAGGPTGDAATDIVRVVKDRRLGGMSSVVNVERAIESGAVDNLPLLDSGDTVIIPRGTEPYTGSSGVNVSGAVLTPGVYRLTENQNLMGAILAGGGLLPNADLKKVKVLRPQSNGTILTIHIDFKRYLDAGDPVSNPVLKPGDTVNIPRQNELVWGAKTNPNFLLGVATTIVSITVLFAVQSNN